MTRARFSGKSLRFAKDACTEVTWNRGERLQVWACALVQRCCTREFDLGREFWLSGHVSMGGQRDAPVSVAESPAGSGGLVDAPHGTWLHEFGVGIPTP